MLNGIKKETRSDYSSPSSISNVWLAGDQCPSGHYCEAGSSTYTPCDPGYYQPSAGGQNVSWCILCTAGKYCNSSGLSAPDGDCDAGKAHILIWWIVLLALKHYIFFFIQCGCVPVNRHHFFNCKNEREMLSSDFS